MTVMSLLLIYGLMPIRKLSPLLREDLKRVAVNTGVGNKHLFPSDLGASRNFRVQKLKLSLLCFQPFRPPRDVSVRYAFMVVFPHGRHVR
jgi:hypothetical protein